MSICLIDFLIGYFRRTLHIPKLGVIYKNEGILLEVIFGDTYSITFSDGLVILKPQPNFFSISYLVSHL